MVLRLRFLHFYQIKYLDERTKVKLNESKTKGNMITNVTHELGNLDVKASLLTPVNNE